MKNNQLSSTRDIFTIPSIWKAINKLKGNNITGEKTYTVGAGKNFETLHLALRWLESVNQTGGGFINFILDDGVYVLGGEGDFDEENWCYYTLQNKNINIISASGVKGNVIITLDGWDDEDSWGTVITVYNSYLLFSKVTLDAAEGGYPYSENITFIAGYYSLVLLVYSTIKNLDNVSCFRGGMLNLLGILVDNIKGGIIIGNSANGVIQNSSIQNSENGIYVSLGSQMIAASVTFINNTTDTNIPLNEIQYDNSLITTTNAPITLKP